jgi:MFS family permease
MASVNIFNDAKIVRYLKEICLLLIWISSLVIAITTTARQIPAERENRTLLPLLAKPLTRTQLIFGKFLGCWLACGLALLCFYVFFGALAASREHAWPLLNYFQAATLHWFMLGIVVAMVLLGSLVFAAPSSNSTICFVIVAAVCLSAGYLDRSRSRCRTASLRRLRNLFCIPHLERFECGFNHPRLAADSVAGIFRPRPPLRCWLTRRFSLAACLVFRRKAVN